MLFSNFQDFENPIIQNFSSQKSLQYSNRQYKRNTFFLRFHSIFVNIAFVFFHAYIYM